MPDVAGFWGALTDAERAAFEAAGRRRRYRAGAALFHEGDDSDHVVMVESGRVKVSSYTEDGREVVLGFRPPGELLGDMSALDGEPRSGTVSAVDPVEGIVMKSAEFEAFLEAHPRMALVLLRMLIHRLRDSDRKRVEFGSIDTTGRVARRLVELAENFGEVAGKGVRIALPLSQEELAGWTGSSREAVAKALRTLREHGWIETGRRAITILDPTALNRRAT